MDSTNTPRYEYLDEELKLDNTYLETVCEKFNFLEPPFDPIKLSNTLTVLREKLGGIGLAANQVGIPFRVISVKGIDTCLFNPIIVHRGEESKVQPEGCLSFPGLAVKIKRPTYVRIRYTTAQNEVITKTYHHMTARVIQHEIDHLDGIHFWTRANQFHREQAFRQFRRNQKRIAA